MTPCDRSHAADPTDPDSPTTRGLPTHLAPNEPRARLPSIRAEAAIDSRAERKQAAPVVPPVILHARSADSTPSVLPDIGPGTPGLGGASGTAVGTTMVKPATSTTVVPAIERTPTTSYNVDLYEVKQNDTWESISQEFYNNKSYAAALKAANKNTPAPTGTIDIPPIYILKQKFSTRPNTSMPISRPRRRQSSARPWPGLVAVGGDDACRTRRRRPDLSRSGGRGHHAHHRTDRSRRRPEVDRNL